ncbi:hypothetical protein DFJ77DRAFT_546834 [Powellomyces hirtus]|nr:hypothetical protein DFJ77DRAFT_546834 [Powellomyces hirtus]
MLRTPFRTCTRLVFPKPTAVAQRPYSLVFPGIPDSPSSAPSAQRLPKKKNEEDASIPDPILRLDLRVGKIIHIESHDEAEKLYVERIDLGVANETVQQTTIVSGLKPYYTLEELKGRNVVVVRNLKPSSLRGVRSNGMLLAAFKDDRVEVLEPPADAAPGDKVWIPGFDQKPSDTTSMVKKKLFDACQVHFRTNADCIATYKGHPLQTIHGPVKVKTLADSPVS